MITWTNDTVMINHHSTSSLVEIIVTSEEEDGQGGMEETVDKIWLDYKSFDDLKELLSQIRFP